MRFSLKLLFLVSVLTAVVVAYATTRSQITSMRGHSIDHWRSFHGKSGYRGDGNGGIQFGGNGRALSAEVRSPRELSLLRKRTEVLAQLTSLQIFGEETYHAFEPRLFPKLEALSLVQISPQSESLLKLGELRRLKRIRIAEHRISPDALSAFEQISSLDHLHVWTDSEFQAVNFPSLSQLSLFVLTAPNADENLRELLQQQLPSCDIVIHQP